MKRGKGILLIFDFDGTIVDSKAVYYKSINSEMKKYGFSEKEIDKAIDIGLSLRKTLANFGLNFITSWFVKKRIMKKTVEQVEKVKKCKDIDKIKKIKHNKIIVTNSLKEFAIPVLKKLKLRKDFKEVYGADDFDDKTDFIKHYLEKRRINPENCYYIGDRAADVEVARKTGIKSIIITGKCSWDSKKELIKASPDFIINELGEVEKIVN